MNTAPAPKDESPRGGAVPARYETATRRADRRWHRALSIGVVGAVLFHLAALLFFRTAHLPPPSPFSASGPDAGDIRASEAGGTGLTMVEVRVERPPEEEVVEVVPVPEVIVPVEVPRPTPTPAPASVVTPPSQQGTGGAGTGGDSGQTTGSGAVAGDGAGGGGTGAEGAGSTAVIAPVPRGMILPPADRPRSVRGMEVTVWVYVTDRGRVVAETVRLDPATPDSRYNERLRRSAAEWVFEPARQDGRPVGAWYPYEIIL